MAGTEQPLRQPSEAALKALTAVALSSPACLLCGQEDEVSDILGPKCETHGSYFHTYCALFANGLCQEEGDGSFSISKEDAIRTIEQAEQTHCIVCGKTGASITCAETGCDRSFHLPCASEGECVTQYIHGYSSFCWEHRPQQAVEAVPAQDTTCIMCMDPMGDSISYSTMVCPCCQHAWFHRACVQEYALCAGNLCFCCPLCKDMFSFFINMLMLGIRIPVRRPRWEDDDAYSSLLGRHRRCDASECHYPHGREHAEGAGPWELLLCSSCAAQGTHRCCSNLSESASTWECNACAGAGTDSSTTSQQGLEPSQGSPALESSTSSTTSQAPSGPDHGSYVPESSGLSRQHGTDCERISPRLTCVENSFNELRGHRRNCRNAALDLTSQGMSEASRPSLAHGYNLRPREGGWARTRSHSPLQCRVPDSPSQPRTRRGSRHTPTPSAESCTHSCSQRAAPWSLRVSAAADGSQCTQPGRTRTQSRSPLKCHDAESQSQPCLHRRVRSRRTEPAQEQSRVPCRAQNINSRSQHHHGSSSL
ncbi:PHD finger protein 7-like [Cyrtonyx montezumae]|uniref:PHD finger protein 7-like n=1 Tax=Cyrtonyx montezumae TaxID=9017 RepID=UPI0032DB60B4